MAPELVCSVSGMERQRYRIAGIFCRERGREREGEKNGTGEVGVHVHVDVYGEKGGKKSSGINSRACRHHTSSYKSPVLFPTRPVK